MRFGVPVVDGLAPSSFNVAFGLGSLVWSSLVYSGLAFISVFRRQITSSRSNVTNTKEEEEMNYVRDNAELTPTRRRWTLKLHM